MKPTFAGTAAAVAIAATITFGIQEGRGNAAEPAGQLTTAQIESELKVMNVYKETVKDEDGVDVFEMTLDGLSVQLFAVPSTGGAPQYWRLSAGWDLAAAPRPDDVNKFNMASHQAFSYLDNEYDPFLVLDQNVAAGSSVEMLHSVVDSYRAAIPAFKAVVLRNRTSGVKLR